jgi:hypothetical protein
MFLFLFLNFGSYSFCPGKLVFNKKEILELVEEAENKVSKRKTKKRRTTKLRRFDVIVKPHEDTQRWAESVLAMIRFPSPSQTL